MQCYICGKDDGFMKSDKPTSMSGRKWWHPFCVLTNTQCVFRDLANMKDLKGLDLGYSDNAEDTCVICKRTDKYK